MFYELVGAEEHIDSVVNLHKVFLSLVLSMEDTLFDMTIEDMALHAKLTKVLEAIKLKVSQTDLI